MGGVLLLQCGPSLKHTGVNMKKLYQDCDWLCARYRDDRLSCSKIGALVGVDQKTIFNWLVFFGIGRRNQGAPHNYVEITENLSEFIDGWLLSDLCVFTQKNNTKSAKIQGSFKHRGIAESISNSLSLFGVEQAGCISEHTTIEMNNRQFFSYQSRYYCDLLDVRNKWYNSDRKKIVPRDIILTPSTVMNWYLGDGSLKAKKRVRPNITLSTYGFTKDCVKFLVLQLRRIGIESTRVKDNSIYIGVNATEYFLDYLGPCPPEIYNIYGYKFDLSRRGTIEEWRKEHNAYPSNTLPVPLGGRAMEAT